MEEYKFAGYERRPVEHIYEEEQQLNRLGETTREGKKKPFRDVLVQRMKSAQFNATLDRRGGFGESRGPGVGSDDEEDEKEGSGDDIEEAEWKRLADSD